MRVLFEALTGTAPHSDLYHLITFSYEKSPHVSLPHFCYPLPSTHPPLVRESQTTKLTVKAVTDRRQLNFDMGRELWLIVGLLQDRRGTTQAGKLEEWREDGKIMAESQIESRKSWY